MAETVLLEVLKTVGPWGLIGLGAWYLLTKMIPKMLTQFREELAQERKTISALDQHTTENLRQILFALNQNVMAMRYLIATVTKADYKHTDMQTLLCPHDGRPCTDGQRVKEYKEELHGADTGGIPAPAANLGSPQ